MCKSLQKKIAQKTWSFRGNHNLRKQKSQDYIKHLFVNMIPKSLVKYLMTQFWLFELKHETLNRRFSRK